MFQLSGIEIKRCGRKILEIDSLQIPTDQLTVILGHNGSGKSTLVSLISGQNQPDKGTVKLNDDLLSTFSAKSLAKKIAFLPQYLPSAAGLSVRELVFLGRFPWRGAFKRFNAKDKQIVKQAMEQTGVLPFADTIADELSGGERQCAWISMLLAQQAPVLIFDEPVSALDVYYQYQTMKLLAELNKKHGCGIIVILHDLNLALRYATHIIALKRGKVVFKGNAELLANEEYLSELYQTPIQLINHPMPNFKSKTNKVAIVCS